MNEHKNIITIEDEIKEFSDKPVKSSALFNALKERGVPDSSEASAGDVLSLNEDKKPTWTEPSQELPDIQSSDGGKVLTVSSGGAGVEWKNVPNELPAIGDSDAGKVLQVNSGHTGVEWGSIPNELPAIAAGDAGKVLKVNSGHTGVEWGEAGGGKLYQHIISLKFATGADTVYVVIAIITNKASTYTVAELGEYLYNKGVTSDTTGIPVNYLTARNGSAYWYPKMYAKYNQYVTPNYYLSLNKMKFSVDQATGNISYTSLSDETNPTWNSETVYEI